MENADQEAPALPSGGGVAYAVRAVVHSSVNGQFESTFESPMQTLGLSERQEAFCKAYVRNGANGKSAAITAGYAADGKEAAFALLRNPKIRARIHEIVQIKMETKGAVIGFGVLVSIAQDTTAPPGVRRHCARDLLELSGFFKSKEEQGANTRKSLAEMTREELEEVVSYGAAVLMAAGKTQAETQAPVDVTPKPLETLDK